MDPTRHAQLTTRHREVLRLHHQRYGAKEIGDTLQISHNTASKYLTEAARLLDLGGRRAAANALVAFESAHPEARGRFSVGDETPVPAAIPASEEGEPDCPVEIDWATLLPFPTTKGAANDLSIAVRLFWIAAITLMAVIAVLLFIATGAALKQL